ncbi:MAG: hypothetical protein H0W36_03140 [Gemmatimonadetes bacterium]|nr:hypothetical protein [Gemmatimonadota bacterium]
MPSPRTLRSILVPLSTLIAVACSQRVVPEEEYASSERERPLLSPAEVPRGFAVGDEMAAPVEPFQGTIVSGPDAPLSGAVLFLYVRPAEEASGPPLAALRLPAGGLPQDFAIGPGDAMLPGTVFPERVTVEARLDQDGDPLTIGPEDWTARSGPVAPGTRGLRLELRPPESGR